MTRESAKAILLDRTSNEKLFDALAFFDRTLLTRLWKEAQDSNIILVTSEEHGIVKLFLEATHAITRNPGDGLWVDKTGRLLLFGRPVEVKDEPLA